MYELNGVKSAYSICAVTVYVKCTAVQLAKGVAVPKLTIHLFIHIFINMGYADLPCVLIGMLSVWVLCRESQSLGLYVNV